MTAKEVKGTLDACINSMKDEIESRKLFIDALVKITTYINAIDKLGYNKSNNMSNNQVVLMQKAVLDLVFNANDVTNKASLTQMRLEILVSVLAEYLKEFND